MWVLILVVVVIILAQIIKKYDPDAFDDLENNNHKLQQKEYNKVSNSNLPHFFMQPSHTVSINKKNAQILAPQYLRIVEDSMRLINTTKKPDVFFSRYELLLNKIHELIEIEKYVKFSGEKPSKMLKQVEGKYTHSVNDFIDRFYNDTVEKIKTLKTDKAKGSRIQKFYEELQPYFHYIDTPNVSKINGYLESLRMTYNFTGPVGQSSTTTTKGSFTKYWCTLSKDEFNCFQEYYPKYVGQPFEKSLVFSGDDIASFTNCLMVYYAMKKYDYCKRALNYVEDHNITSRDAAIMHFFYLYAVKFLYQPTKPENDAEKAKEYCYKDIDLVLNNLEAIKNIGGDGELPSIPTIKTLAIILGKEQNYEEAIRICDIALKLGLDDGTKGGYVARKEKLLKKKSQ